MDLACSEPTDGPDFTQAASAKAKLAAVAIPKINDFFIPDFNYSPLEHGK